MSAKKSSSSAKKVDVETFETRDIVLAKVRGFPAWPGMVSRRRPILCDIWGFLGPWVISGADSFAWGALSLVDSLWHWSGACAKRVATICATVATGAIGGSG
ncbi:hypothetical protein DFH06DRAFT_1341287 [Mycena polygramma]|nr:hypothetical protein DFH06DRAFT_1341287 [Mycena polygramma]